ncbi:endo alpha-1,4 polygalactosaminidase [Microbacterium sp. 1.5R]|uniref:endo alpha-1,4 polygalactosaminidase n=1 Tax=Microbacterium sp. 1.5R TaxID=1916917 RepID=UPI0021B400AB|nr:endo alpha-1,4 polygalactosaminidase [Microbacterium sp. 1.5R]
MAAFALAAALGVALVGCAGQVTGGETGGGSSGGGSSGGGSSGGGSSGGGSSDTAPATPSTGDSGGIAPLPSGAQPDYQLGGAYDPADGVGIVGRDRSDEPADGVYSICYVNGFQTQPGELDAWPDDLLLQDAGEPVFDPDWPDEALLDTSTGEHRERIAEIVGPWIDGCADAGFDAVEFDNLDSYTRSDDALSLDDNLALGALFVARAHSSGLAAGQKNAAEDAVALRDRAGFDFAVVEECAAYEECGAYTAVYGDQVIDIEYTDGLPRPFAEMCADPDSPASMVLRDRDLQPGGAEGHVFETCR